MCQLYITESKTIGHELCEKNRALIEKIDENVRVWIVKKSNNCLWELAIDEGRVTNPENNKPFRNGSDVKQIIIVDKIGEENTQALYGSPDSDLNSFVEYVLESLTNFYPRH